MGIPVVRVEENLQQLLSNVFKKSKDGEDKNFGPSDHLCRKK